MILPVFLTVMPIIALSLESLYFLEVSLPGEEEEKMMLFCLDDKKLWEELCELFQRLQKGEKALAQEGELSYVEIEEFLELPEDCLVITFGKSDIFYCIRLCFYNVSSLMEEDELLICFSDKSFAYWFGSIIDRAMKLKLRRFGVG